jgi:hypothetical protein
MTPDMRPATEITTGDHAYARAYARAYGRYHVVRGIDRFTHLPTRERAAMVWIRDHNDRTILAPVALDDICIFAGRTS